LPPHHREIQIRLGQLELQFLQSELCFREFDILRRPDFDLQRKVLDGFGGDVDSRRKRLAPLIRVDLEHAQIGERCVDAAMEKLIPDLNLAMRRGNLPLELDTSRPGLRSVASLAVRSHLY